MNDFITKLSKKIKKSYKQMKYLDRTKARFFMVVTFISFFCLFVGGTYAAYAIRERLESSIITIAKLKYELTSENEDFNNNSIVVKPGETLKLTLDLRSLNNDETKYALDAFAESNDIVIYYEEKIKQNVEGNIGGLNSIINIKIVIENRSSNNQTVNFELKGGYLQNVLNSNIDKEYIEFNSLVPQIVAHIIDGRPLPDDALLKNTTPEFSKTAPIISDYKANTSADSTTRNLKDDGTKLFYTYADSYSFDSNTGLYTLNGAKTCVYSNCYENLKGKYLLDYRGISTSQIISSTSVGVIYKVENTTTANKLVYQTLYQGADTADNSDDGIFTMDDDYGTSYYFRGDMTNNYVKFGTWKEGDREGSPMYWRIIRVNGNGSVRMIYDGTSPYDNNIPSQDRVALTDIPWNETNYNDTKYIGYMYGGANGVASTSKEEATRNQTDSFVKYSLDNWYETNLSDVDEYIADSIFCNDRSIGIRGGLGWGQSSGTTTDATFYAPYDRLKTNKTPSLKCPQKNDAFTVNDTEKGNGKLTYKIGLPRADEVALAGGVNGKSNSSYYLYKGYWYRTSTPYAVTQAGGAGIMFVDTAGNPLSNRVDEIGDVAPVINLNADFAKGLKGDGTKENPYQKDLLSTKVSFTLNFDANGGSVSPETKEVQTETTYGELPTPTRANYKFDGWYTKADGGYLITENTSVLLSYKTLYAHWTPIYTITFDATGGTVSPSEKKVAYGEPYGDLPIPKKDNYYFLGWFTEQNGGTQVLKEHLVTSTQTLYAHWEKRFNLVEAVTAITNGERPTEVKEGQPNFASPATTDETLKELYSMEDDYGTSYYYRGAVENNYVKFGDYFWRIIRINGDGSLRMIYDGTQAYANGTSDANRLAWTPQAFNTNYGDAKYVGYMYGPAGTTASTSKEQAQTNTESSTIKTILEEWYVNNIKSKGLDQYVADSIFCNDRSTPGKEATGLSRDTGKGYGSNYTAYGAYARLYHAGTSGFNPTPQFTCPQKNDAFTVEDIEKGNGALEEKVGLITADEIVAAGSGKYRTNNTSYYLYKGNWYWSLSPYDFYGSSSSFVFLVYSSGRLDHSGVGTAGGVAPVINLKAEYVKTLRGEGTMSSPYTSE